MPDDLVQLCDAVQAGDEAAGELLDGRLRGWLTSLTRNAGLSSDADDVVQETLIAVQAQLRAGAFRRESNPRTWVLAILRNKVHSAFRRHAAYERLFAPLSDERSQFPAVLPPDQGMLLEVRSAFMALTARERFTLYKMHVEDWPASRIAEVLRVKVNSVYPTVHRARQKFAAHLRRTGADARGIARPRGTGVQG
jgi:RNA polymerase sigma-70 factor (ECF subfamily)